MLQFSDGKHHDVYGPDTLQVMGAAFDAAVQALPRELQDRERARTRLRCSSFDTRIAESPRPILAVYPCSISCERFNKRRRADCLSISSWRKSWMKDAASCIPAQNNTGAVGSRHGSVQLKRRTRR